jgi:hypothetical protein
MNASRLVIGLLTAAVVVGVSAAYADPTEEGPTVTFSGAGPVPLVCASRPDVSGITIGEGSRVTLINQTGTAARVDVGNRHGVFTVDNGAGVALRLSQGQHAVRLVPDCATSADNVDAVTVDVVEVPDRGRPTPSSPAPWAGPSPAWSGNPGPVSMSGPPGRPGVTGPPSRPDPAGQPGAISSLRAAPAGPTRVDGVDVLSDGSGSDRAQDVYDVLSFPAIGGDEQAGHLLAVVAFICVLGMTTAIIRAIVTQRPNSAMLR